ncbi:MAG TPA: hypothetical protein VF546_24430 [Pyrinomonadaceae bacterium]|jgi:hypothetical protein
MKRTPTAYACVTLCLCASLLGAAPRAAAQTATRGPARDARPTAYLVAAPTAGPRRHLVAPRASATADGTRVTLAADAPLDDYAAYADGARFYVLVPRATAPSDPLGGALSGRGFTAAQLDERAGDVLLSFRLQPGARAHVAQKFNRLDIVFTVPPDAANTQPPAPQGPAQVAGDDHELIRQLLRRIEQLEGQVAELKANAANTVNASAADANAAAGAPHGAAQTQTPADEPDAQAQAVLDEHEHTTGPHLQIQGFADVNFRASNQRGSTNSFSLGQLDLFLTSRLSDKFSVLGELIVQPNPDNSFNFEIHRLLLRYEASDFFNLSMGRYHTAIGYYNTAFHHGSWFATAANRPFVYAFESAGGPLPLHNSGLSATGRIPSGGLGLRYVAEIGNGRSARAAADRAVQTSFDENNGKAFNLALVARPDAAPGLQLGFSFYRDRLTPTQAPNVRQEIMAGHVVYKDPRYEWLNEAVVIRHAPEGTGRVFYTPAMYTQLARRFGRTSPYFRYQYFNAPGDDPIYRNTGRRNGPSVGVRFDVTDYAALKAQYDRTERRRQQPLDELILQLAFTF